jgi:cyclic-di-GMP-binding biofilm dispersal mediator protein
MPLTPNHPIVVIGATGELGRRIAVLLCEHASVSLVVRDASRLSQDLAGLPVQVADVRDALALSSAFAELARSTGALGGIVIASGVVGFGQLGALPPGATDEVIMTNTLGVLHTLDAGTPLIAEGGFVLNLSGVAAEMDLIGMGAYCASKAAASAAMRVAARELRSRKIRAIDVRVGHTETGLVSRSRVGTAPAMPSGLNPDQVASRIVTALLGDERDLPPAAF